MVNPYGSFWQVAIYADDTKGTEITNPSNRIFRVGPGGIHRVRTLNTPPQYNVSLILEDKLTDNLAMGAYFEVTNGAPNQALWYAGYVEEVDKSWSTTSQLAFTGIGALASLADFRLGDNHYANWGLGYHNLLDYFNGVNQVGQPAGTNQKGVLPPTWRAKWVDGSFAAAASSTTVGSTPVNATTIAVASSSGLNITNRAVQIGGDWYALDPTTPNPDGTHIRICGPGTIQSYTAGTAVKMASYMLPGTGHSWYVANDNSWNTALAACKVYNVQCREGDNSLATSGVLELGPFRDVSGLVIWGGEQLAAQQGRDTRAFSHHPDYAKAQKDGLTTIEDAQRVDNLSHMINVCWPYGQGHGDSARKIKSLMGGDPTPGGPFPSNGWNKYTPVVNGIQYYLKPASATTWNLNTYEYICFQRQDGKFQYGVINRGNNTGTNQPPPFGLRQTVIKKDQIKDPTTLLAEALGVVEYNADPVPSVVFTLKHPFVAVTGKPAIVVKPGQTVDVRFTGQVNNAVDVSTAPGPTYGQLVDIGSYMTIKYPTVADSTDENGAVDINKTRKMAVCVQYEDMWQEGGTYQAVATMGRGHWEAHELMLDLAKDMEAKHHAPDPYHSFVTHPFHHLGFLFPTFDPAAWEQDGVLTLAAGAFVPSDHYDPNWTGNGHRLRFTFTFTDSAQYIDFVFGKDLDATLTNQVSNSIYALYRVAGPTSGKGTGFKTRDVGTINVTSRGRTHSAPGLLDGNSRLVSTGTYTVFLTWLDNKLTALVTKGDLDIDPIGNVKYPHLTSIWNDKSLALNKYGAIGFIVTGGAAQVRFTDLHGQAYHGSPPPKNSVTRTAQHDHHPMGKRRRKTTLDATGHRLMTVLPI